MKSLCYFLFFFKLHHVIHSKAMLYWSVNVWAFLYLKLWIVDSQFNNKNSYFCRRKMYNIGFALELSRVIPLFILSYLVIRSFDEIPIFLFSLQSIQLVNECERQVLFFKFYVLVIWCYKINEKLQKCF